MPIGTITAGTPDEDFETGAETEVSAPAGSGPTDLMLIRDVVVHQTAVAPTPITPAGWQVLSTFTVTNGSARLRHTWFWRVGAPPEPVVVDIVGTVGTQHRSQMLRVPGAKITGTAAEIFTVGAQANPANSASIMGPIAGLTTPESGCAVLFGAVRENDLTDGTTIAVQTQQSGFTLALLDSWGAIAADNWAGALAAAVVPTAAAVTAKSFTATAGSALKSIGQMIAVRPAAAAAPTVSAGPDVPSHPVDVDFIRTATENDNGSPITARQWLIVSGPSAVGGTVNSQTAVFASSTPGTYVLRYSATNAVGTSSDDMTLVIVAPDGPDDYFTLADWHWQPIGANPQLDQDSAAQVAALADGGEVRILNTVEFGNSLYGPNGITAATPRYDVAFTFSPEWGPDPFGADTMPIPDGVRIPGGSDGHVAVADPTTSTVYATWMLQPDGSGGYGAGWGAKVPLFGDGIEPGNAGSSTGAGLSRYACVVRVKEIQAGYIPHALFFSTNIAREDQFRYPASKTDGSNIDGVPANATVPEGARIQLDPSIDVDAIPGITPAEATIAKALQTFGAYCGDNGGARMAFLCELAPDAVDATGDPGAVYTAAGITGDYQGMPSIPWGSLRVLSTWDGGVGDAVVPVGQAVEAPPPAPSRVARPGRPGAPPTPAPPGSSTRRRCAPSVRPPSRALPHPSAGPSCAGSTPRPRPISPGRPPAASSARSARLPSSTPRDLCSSSPAHRSAQPPRPPSASRFGRRRRSLSGRPSTRPTVC